MANNVNEMAQHKVGAVLNLSNVYQNSGKNKEVIVLLESTIKSEKLSKIQQGMLYNNLGSNYMLISNFDLAKKALKESVNLLKNEPSSAAFLSNSYRNLVIIYRKEQNFALANTTFDSAKKLFLYSKIKDIRKLAQLYYDEALLTFDQKKSKETKIAIANIFKTLIPSYNPDNQILPKKQSLYGDPILLDAIDLQAAVYNELNEPKRALQAYDLSFYIEELLQSMMVYENSKIINVIRNRNRTEKCIDICQLLFKNEQKRHYLEKAFLLCEQSKAAILKSYSSKMFSKEEKIILEQIGNCNTTIVKEQQKDDNANIVIINEAIKKQNELMLLLKVINKKILKENTIHLSIDSLYKKVTMDKITIVSYFSGNNTTYSFTVENDKITMHKQNAKKLNVLINHFLDFFKDAKTIASNPKMFNRIGNALYNSLQIPESSKNKNLIIIPDGILNFLPFETLISERTSTTNFSKMHYLLHDFTISYNNSASFYLNQLTKKSGKETVLGVFPIFKNTNLELTFSKKEMDAIQQNFKGDFLDNEKATFINFKYKANHNSILHLSTHASSGDIIDPSSIKFFDRDILYSELYHLNLKPNLVVLSACETGLGKLYKGEGAMSIARGFQVSGTQNILFSLWKVNDFTTSKLMSNFYQNIHDGMTYQDANYQSKLQFLKDPTVTNSKKSPYYWAPFVYYGTIENKNESKLWLWGLGLLSVVITFFFLWKKFKQ
jgi:CHAT domain-containing protein